VASIGNSGANSALGTNGTITIGGGSNSGSLTWTGTTETTDKVFAMGGSTGNATLSASTSGQTLSISQNLLISGTGAKTLTLSGSGNIAFLGVIPNGTSPNTSVISLTKSGSGTATLAGTNTYSGATTISAGTLQIGNGGSTGNLSSTSAITNNANLAFNRSDTLTQGTDFSAIAGTGNVTQAGSGTTILASANTYTGTTRITAGTLQIGNSGTTGNLSTSSTITNNGTLAFNRTNDVVQGTDFSASAITGTGNLTQSGTGNLTLNAANTYTGVTTINSGTLIASGGSAIADTGTVTLANTSGALFSITGNETIGSLRGGGNSGGNVTIAASQTLTVEETGTQAFSGSIQGSGTLTKTGLGTLSLNGTNTYSGATTITAGTLQIGNGSTTGTLSLFSAITNNATMAFNRNNTITQGTDFNSVIGGSGSIIQAGSGNLVLSGVNTYSGNTTVSSGTLEISNASALGGTGNGTTVAAGAVLAMSGNTTITSETLSLSGNGGGTGALRNLSGSNSWNATITLLADTTIGSDAGTLSLVPGAGTITSGNYSLTLPGAGNFNIARQIALGTGGLTMNGTGSFTMGTGGSSSYTGATTINSGTLTLGNNDRINDASSLIINGGVFSMTTRNETIAGVTLTGGSITSSTGTIT
jgi:autotransporter-associated beta strand protein